MKKSVCILAFAIACISAGAQGVHSTVEVTNDYQSHVADAGKQTMDMLVPDSLLHFEYKFDYSVFESPYRGAYEFSPYSVKVSPQSAAVKPNRLFFRAGAGYALQPVLDFVWAPDAGDKCAVSIFNTGRGFYGNYAGKDSSFDGYDFTGYDASDTFGAEARWVLDNAEVKARATYDFIGAGDKDKLLNSMTHAVHGGVGVASVGNVPVAYAVNVRASYLKGTEHPEYDCSEWSAGVDGSVGMGRGAGRIGLDFLASYYSNNGFGTMRTGEENLSVPHFMLTPRYEFTYGVFNINAGARFDYAGKFGIAPDVRANVGLFGDDITVYAGVTGGRTVTDYFTLKQNYHRARMTDAVPGVTSELFHVYAGFDGHYGSPFRYALRLGWRKFDDAPLETLYGYTMASFARVYAKVNLSWVDERVEADANVGFSSILRNASEGIFFYRDPAVTGSANFTYNWNKRIYAGIWGEGRTSRESTCPDGSEFKDELPGYFNLGVRVELKPTYKWGVWAEAGNLLGMEMWHNPVCAQKGRIFTAGITLTL